MDLWWNMTSIKPIEDIAIPAEALPSTSNHNILLNGCAGFFLTTGVGHHATIIFPLPVKAVQ